MNCAYPYDYLFNTVFFIYLIWNILGFHRKYFFTIYLLIWMFNYTLRSPYRGRHLKYHCYWIKWLKLLCGFDRIINRRKGNANCVSGVRMKPAFFGCAPWGWIQPVMLLLPAAELTELCILTGMFCVC